MESIASKHRPPRRRLADLPSRVAFALPAIGVAVALVAAGGWWFTAGIAVIGTLALHEACRLLGVAPRVELAAIAGVLALAVVAMTPGREGIPPALAGGFALLAVVAAAEPPRTRLAALAPAGMALVWVGFGVAHAILLRELPHGGALVLDVLLAVFVGDTVAHLIGSLFGRTKLAPTISPNKTVEGLVAGIVAGTAAVCAVAALAQDWLAVGDAALIGLTAAVIGPVGDLFESMIKRETQIKDSGRLLGPHGGALDRVDAVLFAVVAGYYVALAVL